MHLCKWLWRWSWFLLLSNRCHCIEDESFTSVANLVLCAMLSNSCICAWVGVSISSRYGWRGCPSCIGYTSWAASEPSISSTFWNAKTPDGSEFFSAIWEWFSPTDNWVWSKSRRFPSSKGEISVLKISCRRRSCTHEGMDSFCFWNDSFYHVCFPFTRRFPSHRFVPCHCYLVSSFTGLVTSSLGSKAERKELFDSLIWE